MQRATGPRLLHVSPQPADSNPRPRCRWSSALTTRPSVHIVKVMMKHQVKWKMVNGFRYYRALESVSMIASALSTALTIYPSHARSESINADSLNSNFLQLGRRSGDRPQRAVHPYAVTCQHCDTHYFSRPRTRKAATFRSLVRRATSSATEPTKCPVFVTHGLTVYI